MVDIRIIIVTHNHVSYIGRCVESVLNQSSSCSSELVVVDDGSLDGTREVLENYMGSLTLIARDGGHSFSNNNNIVIQNFSAKYFLALNPDTLLPPNGIQYLHDFMELNPKAGACGPKLVYLDGSLQLSCRRFPNPYTFLVRRTPLRYFLHERMRGGKHLMIDWDHDCVMEVDWLLAACIFLRAEALEQVGYFDERFRLYCEDIDLCYRLWETGWFVYYNPSVVVIHDHQGKSDKALLSRHSLWHYRSMLHYVLRHGLAGFKRPYVFKSS